jgi:hypothetical protein
VRVEVQDSPKRRRFVKVAERRTRRILRDLRLLGNCANTGAYEYREPDVQKIFKAIEQELEAVRVRFRRASGRKEVDFSLDR